jgi:hypothetical protein
LAQRIRERYAELMKETEATPKGEDAVSRLAAKYGVSLGFVRQNLYSTGTGNPTPSRLALKILGGMPEARELGIPDADRLYDEIILPQGENLV